jgi:UDP-N-acetylglucosamine 1-carboxyvinyltransferase
MDSLHIIGRKKLEGEVIISGAKNAALPCLTASLLTDHPLELKHVPMVNDIKTMGRLLREMGKSVEIDAETAVISGSVTSCRAPYERVKTMRASILTLGPLLARYGEAEVSLPGGCAIGARPVDLHLIALEKMGANIEIKHGYIIARAAELNGADISFEKVTVTGTENILMAATLARGTTVLRRTAREPEVGDLVDLLNAMGARISGKGSDTLVIQGVTELGGTTHTICPDRIEAGTYVCAAAMTQSHVLVKNCRPDHLRRFLDSLVNAGLTLVMGKDTIEVMPHDGLIARDIQTEPYPGFPTDMQAQFMALMTLARGRSMITESIFENRFMHVQELVRMGADIKIEGHHALVRGGAELSGTDVMATDLRASACLVLAALVADGETHIRRIYHLDRGYHDLEGKLRKLGAEIRRIH